MNRYTQIEEIDDVPELEPQGELDQAAMASMDPAMAARAMSDFQQEEAAKQNRNEKKSRKAIQKLGMRQIVGVLRVTVKKSKNVLFVIHKPDVFKSPNAETYVVFGEAKSEDSSAVSQAAAAKQFQQQAAMMQNMVNSSSSANDAALSAPLSAAGAVGGAAGADEAVDETGVEAKDIELVMSQAGCSRAAAVKALKENDGDLVNSIMSLSK
jgi:nascent polypeptide-associated complex subunit alpha